MHYRTLGKTGIEISEIGFGAWAIGGDAWGPVEDTSSIRAMERALELGVNFIDTADVYGDGHSETLVARVLRGRRDRVVVATKGGLMGHHRDPRREPVYDRPEKVVHAFEESLRRLETDYIDVYFDHIWWNDQRETDAFLTAFARLKQEGRVRAVGVSTDDPAYVEAFDRDGTLDVVQLDYSLLNRRAEDRVLPYCQERGIGVVVRGPLRMGLLTGKFTSDSTFPEGDVRHGWPREAWYREQLEKTERLRPLTSAERSMGQLALRFVLNHPAVSAAIPGGKTAEQVEQNVAASARPLVTDEDLALIEHVTGEAT
ncbi:aldo/keto reductase [Deinococcus yavapaiensis]|uniref:Aryl-alcohol dehydrogenase-like predicted oxidoreductase n=1 Tax=Deinococcus yavapaiensis KR-236 TaxID=694435 RepID=A0A318S6X5_9DEIO|nr:aldo/keto reductase [Deinococcus yavapaiensis]PYE54643.1 aryl-alcohol dehydrogenase-like predicted oxidoreductase [Deinococcus yavapaiensis KR-236]